MLAIQKISLFAADEMPTYQAGPTFGQFFGDHCTDISKKKACDEVDLEAIARNGRYILVTGSMGNKRKSGKRAKERWFLAQFLLNTNGKPHQGSLRVQSKRGLLMQLFGKHSTLQPYLEKPLQCGGLNIEGLATLGDQIFFGLRSPSGRDEGQAYVVQSPDSILTAPTKQQVEPTHLHVLNFKASDGKPLPHVGIRCRRLQTQFQEAARRYDSALRICAEGQEPFKYCRRCTFDATPVDLGPGQGQ